MSDENWKTELKELFEGLEVIEISKKETVEKFNQFRELVAEPAFELLSEELKEYRVKSYYKKSRDCTIYFWISFPRSRKDFFHYIIYLPKNSVELNLKLLLKARRTKKSPLTEREEEFMEYRSPEEISKMRKEDLILDFIMHFRNIQYELQTRREPFNP
ncbi:MAG: hypothetical protein ACE5LC_06745 [Candidatus Aminicenantales bacterium]